MDKTELIEKTKAYLKTSRGCWELMNKLQLMKDSLARQFIGDEPGFVVVLLSIFVIPRLKLEDQGIDFDIEIPHAQTIYVGNDLPDDSKIFIHPQARIFVSTELYIEYQELLGAVGFDKKVSEGDFASG